MTSSESTVYEQARKMYEGTGKTLEEDIIEHLHFGYVHITPFCIILAKCFDEYWFVSLAVGEGSLRYFLHLMPEYRYYVGWARALKNDHTIKLYTTERLKRLLS